MDKKPYSRNIPDLLPKAHVFTKRFGVSISRYLFFYLVGLFIFLFLLATFLLRVYQGVAMVRTGEEKKLFYWETIIHEHPNFPDAYFKAAVSAVRLREKDKARGYLDQALTLDPLFKEAEALKERIK